MKQLRVLELFSGVGGMHLAVNESGVKAEVVGAVEINTTANEVYRFNFPDTNLMQRNIEALSANDIASLRPDMIVMSPPCQPFSRTGKQKDLSDTRCMALLHFLELLPELWGVHYILLENVKGFEKSTARQELVQVLAENLFELQEFLLSPDQFHVPNKRPRYYLLAKRKPWKFSRTSTGIATELPAFSREDSSLTHPVLRSLNAKHHSLADSSGCYSLRHVLEKAGPEHAVPDKLLERYIWESDLVTPGSEHSCCFTKAYRRYFHGTGSILMANASSGDLFNAFSDIEKSVNLTPEQIAKLRKLGPRFFSPREIMRLMCFPDTFSFPETVTARQASALLGNSINVHVVALLIAYMTDGDLEETSSAV